MRFFLGIILAGLLLAACGGSSSDSGAAAYRIAVVPKSVHFDFWATVQDGAEAAAAERGDVEILWEGPNAETDVAGQIAIIESFIDRNVDALVVAAADAEALVPVLRTARQQGIPVITIDSDTDPRIAASHVGTDNVEGGRRAAELLAAALGGEGRVALIPFIAGSYSSNQREQGFREGLARYPGLQLVAVQYSDSDYGTATAVTEDILTAHPNLDGIFAANEPTVLGAARAIETRALQDQVVLVGFDASPRELDGVRDGIIYGLIAQDPFEMGYQGVVQAMRVIDGEAVPEVIDSGVSVVTQDNLDEYLAEQDAAPAM